MYPKLLITLTDLRKLRMRERGKFHSACSLGVRQQKLEEILQSLFVMSRHKYVDSVILSNTTG